MATAFSAVANYQRTRAQVGYVPRLQATRATYEELGFKSGLEVHQQLKTSGKLFCRCPAGIYHQPDDYQAEVVRHMRPTLSELGEYDGTALMEFKTKKNIVYRINRQTACTYDIDDTPPFPIDREALDIALELALMLKSNVVGELHITRKQYLDGSIPTGFQRTAIVGIEGEIPLRNKKVRIIQLSIEEDSCREVSDVGHQRVYTTDRLGMPLCETVTYPDMLTPDECAEAAQYIRYLSRASGKVRTGIGAAREDVNVSVTGGTRVEIKGVQHIKWIPELTHTEAYRQKSLLVIRDILKDRIGSADAWRTSTIELDALPTTAAWLAARSSGAERRRVVAVNMPHFGGLLSHFTQPGLSLANELSDRLKVIACLERPNLVHSEAYEQASADSTSPNQLLIEDSAWQAIRQSLGAAPDDAQVVVWGDTADVEMAIEVIDERCRLAMEGVPNETRKSMPNGTTLFERVLPGADRMYPDTDSAPISIGNERIEAIARHLRLDVAERMSQLAAWGVPGDTHSYLLKRDLLPLVEDINRTTELDPRFLCLLLGHTLKNIEGKIERSEDFAYERIGDVCRYVVDQGLTLEIIAPMLPVVLAHPKMVLDSVLVAAGFTRRPPGEVIGLIPDLDRKFDHIKNSDEPHKRINWIMGRLRPLALGNIDLAELCQLVVTEVDRV
ncbi:MAG: Glu-tRNA(Gln) amidotransferase subunit GatE [bacterium]